MVNVFDTDALDKRRQSVVRIATGPHGDAKPYLRVYRRFITDDPDPTVRAAAARALSLHGKVSDAPAIATLLEDNNAFVRWEAAKALQRIHNPEVIDELSAALRDDTDADVRMAAADALGQYAQRAVFDTLVGALRDPNHGVVQEARDALRTLTGHAGNTDPGAWMQWAEGQSDSLFAEQQTYTYRPYAAPPGWLEFWRHESHAEPRRPVGLEVAQDEADDAAGAERG